MTDEVEKRPADGEAPASRRWLTIIVVALALQVVIASVSLAGPRPGRYSWQMYSAVPAVPEVWSTADGEERPFDIRDALIHARAELDYLEVVRTKGCELTGADAVRYEGSGGVSETVSCP